MTPPNAISRKSLFSVETKMQNSARSGIERSRTLVMTHRESDAFRFLTVQPLVKLITFSSGPNGQRFRTGLLEARAVQQM